jgi:hypothetical protein
MTERPGPAPSGVAEASAPPAPSRPTAPCDTVWVGEGENVPAPRKAPADWVGVRGCVPVPPPEAVPGEVRVGVGEGVAVSEPVGEGVPGTVGLAEALRMGEAEGDGVGEGVSDCVGDSERGVGALPLLLVRYISKPCTIVSAVEVSTMSAPRGPHRRPKYPSEMLSEISAHAPGAGGASAAGSLAQGRRTTAAPATGATAAVAQPPVAS